MSVYALDFGTTATGMPVHLYRLKNNAGMEVDITDIGASIVAVRVPRADGSLVDVALGFDEPCFYESNKYALGGVVGRCANRIAGAQFELDGVVHHLTANEGANMLHGGRDMWYERLWEGAIIGKKGDRRRGSGANTAIFGLLSPDGDQGFPGDVDVRVTYTLTDENEIRITYDAQPSLPTVINLANHTYWNLNGHDSGSMLDHELHIAAEKYTPCDTNKIPEGRTVNVGGTPFDFRLPKAIGRDLGRGIDNYDHNFVLGAAGQMRKAATLKGDQSGIAMDVLTDLPCMLIYTGLELDLSNGKHGACYESYAGIAIETQYAPDAIHHPTFAQPVFTPEHPFQSRTLFRFGAE